MRFLVPEYYPWFHAYNAKLDLVPRIRTKLSALEPLEVLPRAALDMRLLFHAHTVATGSVHRTFRTEPAGTAVLGITTYMAPRASEVPGLLTDLFEQLAQQPPVLRDDAVLLLAAQLHLAVLCIHPFRDGNGRTARLLERWFIAQKRGEWAYHIRNGEYYADNRAEYLQNLGRIGSSWEALNLERSMPFLQMLPAAIHHQLNS